MAASRPQLAERIWRAIEEARNSPAYRKAELAEGVRH
jgi:polar amino acid transport system substrate-binding protein